MKINKIKKLSFIIAGLLLVTLVSSCEDETSNIGSSLFDNEVKIVVDSTFHKLQASVEESPKIDTRSVKNLLGMINVKEYGDLRCSFISRLLSASALPIPDSLSLDRIDGMKIMLTVPRGSFTGDSLAPQQVKIYPINPETPLPDGITNVEDPKSYCLPEPLSSQTYTLSALGLNDSLFTKSKYIHISLPLDRQFALDVVNQYRKDPSVFQWPATFAKHFPGIYAESSFGKGCIANIEAVNFLLNFHYYTEYSYNEDGETKVSVITNRDSVSLFSTAPEVLCLNNIKYKPSDHIKSLIQSGNKIITTPGGYVVDFRFPASEFIDDFRKENYNLAIVSSLSLSIPATRVRNDLGIGVAPYLLMVKKSESDNFFKEGKVPDGLTSFWASYNSTSGCYSFNALRNYLLNLLKEDSVTPEDEEFVLIPVDITVETVTNYYGEVTATYVTRCAPYMAAPTMTNLNTDNAIISFTYSKQVID